MTLRRLGILQWVGLLAGAAAWAAQHILGFGITQAECGLGGRSWGISNDVWQGVLMGAAVLVVAAAGAAAVGVVVGTRHASYEDAPALGRIRLLAIAAVVGNAIFLMIILLDGTATIVNSTCRQA